jgi:hypothetical protein
MSVSYDEATHLRTSHDHHIGITYCDKLQSREVVQLKNDMEAFH